MKRMMTPSMPSAILVLTTLPDRASAEALAQALVRERWAACVSIGATIQSIYHWQGALETAHEIPLCAKTCADRFDGIAAAIRAHHPYELPQIVAVPITHGYAPYLDWIAAEAAAG
jgi:periplasmic divalent cation tolerance protein